MAKRLIPIPAVSRVAASLKTIIELPIGATYHNLRFALTGTAITVAMVQKMELLLDAKPLQTFTDLQSLMDLNTNHARAADTANEWTWHFKEDDFNDLKDRRNTCLGTYGLQTCTIEITWSAALPADAALKVTAYADTQKQYPGLVKRIRETNLNSAVAGAVDYDKLIKNGAVYTQIHFFKSDINKVLLEVDSNKMIDATKADLERIQRLVRPVAKVPLTAKCTTIDFMPEGDFGDAFDTTGINDLRFNLDFGSAGNCKIVTESVEEFVLEKA